MHIRIGCVGFLLFRTLQATAQAPLLSGNVNHAEANDILDEEFNEWVYKLGVEWGMKGLAIAVVQKGQDSQWHVETKGYGVRDRKGNPVTSEVRSQFA